MQDGLPVVTIRGRGRDEFKCEVNGKPVERVLQFMAYQDVNEPYPTVILKFHAEVQLDLGVPTLYIERENKHAIQSQAGRGPDEGESVAGQS